MKQTTNYSLNKIELADSPPDITVLNPNFDKIDTEMKRLTDKDTSVDATIEQIKKDYLPKTGGDITNNLTVKSKYVARSVNGEVADANGNIVIDVKGDVRSVNGIRPDEAGNVTIKAGVVSVNNVKPDPDTGDIDLGERIKDASSRTDILEAVAQAGFNGKALQADVEVIKNSYVKNVNGATADPNGTVSLSKLENGAYTLEVQSTGFFKNTCLGAQIVDGATLTVGGVLNEETGEIDTSIKKAVFAIDPTKADFLDFGYNHDKREGALFFLRSINYANEAGYFGFVARNATQSCGLSGTPSGILTWGGTIKGATIQSTSDIRKKSELIEVESCLDKLGTLNAYTYNLDGDDSGRRAGLIAQEVEQVLPEAVREDEDGFLSLDYNGVIALLLGAVKELKEEIEELKK